jgi:hypothetical protein
MALSLQAIDEVVGEGSPSRVLRSEALPVLADQLGRGVWFDGDDHLDLGERELQLT